MRVNKIQTNPQPNFKAKLKFVNKCEFPVDLSTQLARVPFIGRADDIISVEVNGTRQEWLYWAAHGYLSYIGAKMFRNGQLLLCDGLNIESGSAERTSEKMQNLLSSFLSKADLK